MASCASVGKVKEGDALDIVALVNEGDIEALTAHSKLPFVYNREILDSEAQLRLLWSGLRDADFIPGEGVIQSFRLVLPEDRELFSSDWEVSTWFDLVLKEEDHLAQVETPSAVLYMILRPVKGRTFKILAFREGTP